MSRTRKRPYTKSKRFDPSCRNHGGCPWCERNRTQNTRIRKAAAEDELKEFVSAAVKPKPKH